MWPSDNGTPLTVRREDAGARRRSSLIGAVIAALFTSPALAHSLLISRGQAVIHHDKITVEIEIAAEDFLHRSGVVPDGHGRVPLDTLADAADDYTANLDKTLIIRNAAGHRLAGEGFRADFDWSVDGTIGINELEKLRTKYTASFSMPARTPVVLFQLRHDASSMTIPWQLVLGLRGVTQETVASLRLTSRGNTEAVELSWQGDQASVVPNHAHAGIGTCTPCEDRGTQRFKQVCAEIDVGEEVVTARLWVPLPLLSTWIPFAGHERAIAGDEDDFLDLTEKAAAVRAFVPFLREAIAVRTQAGSVAAEISKADIAAWYTHGSGDDAISVWTGGLQADLRFQNTGSMERALLQWNLFNGAVLSVAANVRVAGQWIEHEITTYHPTLDLERPHAAVPSPP